MRKLLTVLIVMALVAVWATPASAQLGSSDVSTFTIQNIDSTAASVTVIFVKEDGTQLTPNPLNSNKPNPFTLQPNESWEVNVSQVPGLQSGRYSVIIGSTKKVIAIGSVGGRGTRAFSGNYIGFSQGANPFYLANAVFNYYGWYSLITVQNLGTQNTNITVQMKCTNVALTGTMTAQNVPPMASATFVLRPGMTGAQIPSGFNANTACSGSATISSNNGQDLVATDAQTRAADGRTQAFNGIASGAEVIYAPALYTNFSGWNSSLGVMKLSGGNTTVTISYSNGGSTKCDLTDAKPDCLLSMPTVHPASGLYGAKITSNNGAKLAGIASSSRNATGQAFTYNLVSAADSTRTVSIPTVFRGYFNWNSSFTCQNVGAVDTQLEITYEGKTKYTHTTVLKASTNDTVQIQQEAEGILQNGYRGSVTIQAKATNGVISCITTGTNRPNITAQPGDWTTSNNGFAR